MTARAPLEANVQRTIIAHLRAQAGITVVKVSGGRYGTGGVSDLIVNYRGVFVGIEVKRPGWTDSDVTEQQWKWLRQVVADGGYSGIASTKDEALALCERAYNELRARMVSEHGL